MKKTVSYFLLLASLAVVFNACKKDDPPLPPISVAFQAAEVGLDAAQDDATITLTLSRASNALTTVTIKLESTGVTYDTDYTTDPVATNNEIALQVPAGSTSATIKVTKRDAILLTSGENVKFTITAISDATALIGTTNVATLKFAAIVSTGTNEFKLPGETTGTGASPFGNVVYVDLSNSAAITADRKSWNLGFKSGSDFRVILNHAYQGVAFSSGKTDIATVTEADAASVNLGFGFDGSLSYIDDITGDLTKTAIAEVKAADGENPVYFVASETNRTTKGDWYKVKITRDGTTGYKVQYAKLSESAIKTVTIAKKADYNFTFFSLENNKEVSVEPRANSWDIVWSYGTYTTNNPGIGLIPYWFQDLVMINSIGGVKAAEIILKEADGTTTATEATTIAKFDAFTTAHIDTVSNFSGARNAIADKWRVTTGAGIRRDRFYLIKDGSGNVYKLRFVRMGVGDVGKRGSPEIDFKLVKKA